MRRESTHENERKEAVGESGDDLRAQVLKALASIPGGASLDKYFGISEGSPEQPAAEAASVAYLISKLRKGAKGEAERDSLVEEIAEAGRTSLANPDALRALMKKGAAGRSRFPGRFLSMRLSTVHYQ